MRNLTLQYCETNHTFLNNVVNFFLDVNATKERNRIFLATENKIFAYNTIDKKLTEIVEQPDIVGLEYLVLDEQICIATENGAVLVVDPETRKVQEGTYCDVGIKCMCWSPDQEVVAFVTSTDHVVVMTCTYDVIAEHVLSESNDNNFISMGWGKSETQFHGSEGTAAAKQKINFPPENINELSKDINITWRGDACYFAVSFLNPAVGRMFKVFNKEGNLCYISERCSQLQPTLAWRPSGNWLAMPQRLPQKSIVTFFEKNGLKHCELTLPFSLVEEPIVKISWSVDSDILALETYNAACKEQRLYLYTIGNYHWYLKQMLPFKRDIDALAAYVWDSRSGQEKTLHILLQSGKYFIYRYEQTINKDIAYGGVGVIDGKKLLLTHFGENIVPPPMCQTELCIDTFINACDFKQQYLLLYDAEQLLHIYSAALSASTEFQYHLTLKPHAEVEALSPLSNLRWCNWSTVVAIDAQGALLLLKFEFDESTYKCIYRQALQSGICAISNVSTKQLLYAQTLDGKFFELHLADEAKTKKQLMQIRKAQQTVKQMSLSSKEAGEHDLISFHGNHSLTVNEQDVANNVTSFDVVREFLVYTQLTTLCFIRLRDMRLLYERKIERGAKLIEIVDCSIVLQMPRGNLEVITPRILAHQHIGQLLDEKKYAAAFNVLRKQRINLNIICDHNMQAFVENIDIFLDAITNPHWLNLFLTDLKNEDFSTTMYTKDFENDAHYVNNFDMSTKVNFICERLCKRMLERNECRFQLPIITAYVKMQQVEKALLVIWRQRQTAALEKENRTSEQHISQADAALRYLLYLVDVNELYNVALGTYDFGLVLFVAQHSQKDPREFLITLNELKLLPTAYRCFQIDNRLKRYERALEHIACSGGEYFPEALEFIKRHTLYRQALKCYGKDESNIVYYKQVALAFGDFLRENGHFSNASLMYERGGDLQQAQHCARHILDWQRVLALAQKQQQNVAQIALALIIPLQEQGEFDAAYQLLRTYDSENVKDAIDSLVKGKLYLKAIYEAVILDAERSDELIVEFVKPALVVYSQMLQKNLETDQDTYTTYKSRLQVIREERANRKLQMNQDDQRSQIDESDLLSDTMSVRSSVNTNTSRGTGKTFRSSKNRRKHERKLLSLKPGNPFEDIALIDALYNHVTKVVAVKQQEHIREICKSLLQLNLDDEAEDLQMRYKKFLQIIEDTLNEIWIPELTTMHQELHLTGPIVDYTQLQNEQRYAMIDSIKRLKPQLQIIDWEQRVLV